MSTTTDVIMSKITCVAIASKIWRSWPPRYSSIKISKSLDIHIQFLTQEGTSMGGKMILTPCSDSDYMIKSVRGFDESQIEEFNTETNYWYRVMVVWHAVHRTYNSLKDKT